MTDRATDREIDTYAPPERGRGVSLHRAVISVFSWGESEQCNAASTRRENGRTV